MVPERLATRFYKWLRGNLLELWPIDGTRYHAFLNGEFDGPFLGYKAAHDVFMQRAKEANVFSDEELKMIADLSNWDTETVDTFDPEEN